MEQDYLALLEKHHRGAPDTERARMVMSYQSQQVPRAREYLSKVGGADFLRGLRVLDVGHAYGSILYAALEMGASVAHGVEIDQTNEPFARALLRGCDTDKYRLSYGDFLNPNVREQLLAEYDLICCDTVLEHVQEAFHMVSLMAELLSPGGRLHIVVPNFYALDFLDREPHSLDPYLSLADTVHWGQIVPNPPDAFPRFSGDYDAMFNALGLEPSVVRTRDESSLGPWLDKARGLLAALPTSGVKDWGGTIAHRLRRMIAYAERRKEKWPPNLIAWHYYQTFWTWIVRR